MATAKPALRNLLMNKTKKDFIIALTVSITCAMAYNFGVKAQRRKHFEEFNKTFDNDAHYERLKSKGVFQFNLGSKDEE
ncbi:unnamed protein product [Lymnaea stagnalis]|uniref:Mitochondrial cytochrome c oxidase subunit VIc/VIIs domain-containing protein n=1 Tax=Lymnaea stagnalis TaxID=6523 RepID=A0AAV2I3B0_LYMST